MLRTIPLLLLLLCVALPLAPAQDENSRPDLVEQQFEQLERTQRTLRASYMNLLARMRASSNADDEATRQRVQDAVRLMDELTIAKDMSDLEKLVEERVINAAIAKAKTISAKIRQVLAVLDGVPQDWKPDERIPTLREQIENLKNLKSLQKELRDSTRALGEQSEPLEENPRKLEFLKHRQNELERLLDELSETMPEDVQPALDEARNHMQQAQEALEQGDLKRAELQQEHSEQAMDRAIGELERKMTEYKDLENENLLIHVEAELARIRAQQVEVNRDTMETHLQVEQGERLGRRHWRSIQVAQNTNKKETTSLAEKVLHGNVPIFGQILKGIARDMAKVSNLLRRRDAGEYTRDLQNEILQRLDDLLDALRAERHRRQNEDRQPPQQTNPDGSPPEPRLVPLPAELGVLLKRQEYLRKKHERFMERFPDVTDRQQMSEAQRRIYERLSQEQGENAGYLDSLLDNLFKHD